MWEELADPQRMSQFVEPMLPLSRRLMELKESAEDPIDNSAADLTVVNRSDEGLVGMVSFRSLNLLNRSAQLEVISAPESHDTSEMEEALGLLIDYLFYQFNLNSVYAEVSELNRMAVTVFKELEFKLDGTLRQRHFFDGTFHDIHAYSLLRFETQR